MSIRGLLEAAAQVQSKLH